MKILFLTFVVAFALNLVWEHLHVTLYDCSAGCNVNTLSFLPLPILVRASLFDAFFITALYIFIATFHRSLIWVRTWNPFDIILVAGIAMTSAALIERSALATHKWTYSPLMPLVPILTVGLSPFLQLALLAFATYTIVQKLTRRTYGRKL